jgi:hypothetical protein
MSQDNQRLTSEALKASRRGLLGFMAAAASALTSGTIANIAAVGMSGATEPDPALVAIAEHLEAMDRWTTAYDRERPKSGRPKREEVVNDEIDALCELEAEKALEVLTVYPTTLAGVIALLNHAGQEEFLGWYNFDEDGHFDTLLTSFSKPRAGEERNRIARDFPMHLAYAIRAIIERGQA